MDRKIWRIVMAAVRAACREVWDPMRECEYPLRQVVAMYLWAVWHDRNLTWACDPDHYGRLFRPRKLPSLSQFSRRIRTDAARAVLQHVHDRLRACGVASETGYFDGKPLTVSPVSKDPDARRGHVTGGFAKGYKLHAYVNEHRRIVVWSVMPLNTDEKAVGRALIEYLPADPLGRQLDMADGNFDAAPLHKAEAAKGRRLLTPLKGQNRVGSGPDGPSDTPSGHHPVTLRQMGPARRELVAAWDAHPGLCEFVLKARNNVEGTFSVLTVACQLGPLPAFARRLERVRRFAGAKIILYHARLLAQEQQELEAAA